MLDFRVLGPLEVWDGERSFHLGGSKRRALLALLVLSANEVVSADRLVDELWGEDSPRGALSALHSHVWRLRKELGPDLLASRGGGYVLTAEPESIDLHRFDRLVAEAEALPAAERAEHLAEALALWRGPALGDLGLENALAGDRARLDERRQVALERRIDADLEAGRHAELVGELEGLIAENPLREHLRGQLILALYRAGRQAEALEAYRETRRLLSEELGLEPSAELRELERAILCHDSALDVPPVRGGRRTKPAPPARRRFVYAAAGALLGLGAIAVAVLALAAGSVGPVESAQRETVAPTAKLHLASPAPTAFESWDEGFSREPAQRTTSPAPPAASRRAGRATSPEAEASVKQQRPAAPRPTRADVPPSAEKRQPTKPSTRPARQRSAQPPSPPPPSPPPPSSPQPKPQPPPPAPQPPSPPPPPPTTPPPPSLADRTTWWYGSSEPGLTTTHTGGRVTFGIPGTAREGFNVSIGTRCKARGDFDEQAGFVLEQWPGVNGVYVSLMASDLEGMNTYRSDSFGEVWGVYIPGTGGTSVPASGDRGTLRLRRQGSIVTGFYRAGDDWMSIFSGPGATGNTSLNLSVFNLSQAPFAGRATIVTFDSFVLTADSLAC